MLGKIVGLSSEFGVGVFFKKNIKKHKLLFGFEFYIVPVKISSARFFTVRNSCVYVCEVLLGSNAKTVGMVPLLGRLAIKMKTW
jgi:hypothetical protein